MWGWGGGSPEFWDPSFLRDKWLQQIQRRQLALGMEMSLSLVLLYFAT